MDFYDLISKFLSIESFHMFGQGLVLRAVPEGLYPLSAQTGSRLTAKEGQGFKGVLKNHTGVHQLAGAVFPGV